MSELIISDLYKSYGKKQVINGMSVSIKPGIFGLLGPNGSGKTTLMKCIVTLLEDYKGKIQYSGIEWKKSSKVIELIGYLPQNFSLYKQLTVYAAMKNILFQQSIFSYKLFLSTIYFYFGKLSTIIWYTYPLEKFLCIFSLVSYSNISPPVV